MGGFDECAWWVGGETEKTHEVQVRTATEALGARTCIFWAPDDYSAVDRRRIEDDRGGHWGAGIGSCLRDYVYEYTR